MYCWLLLQIYLCCLTWILCSRLSHMFYNQFFKSLFSLITICKFDLGARGVQIPGRRQHPGYLKPRRPCCSGRHRPPTAHSASAAPPDSWEYYWPAQSCSGPSLHSPCSVRTHTHTGAHTLCFLYCTNCIFFRPTMTRVPTSLCVFRFKSPPRSI